MEESKALVHMAFESKLKKISNGLKLDTRNGFENKLYEFYLKYRSKAYSKFFRPGNLLENFVEETKANCLLVKLYPESMGYTMSLRIYGVIENEIMSLSYDDTTILTYIDNAELFPPLQDILRSSCGNLFYNGCIIVEIRDYRQQVQNFERKYVLLKPTTESVLHDFSVLEKKHKNLTYFDYSHLNVEPLCLNPSPSAALIANRVRFHENMISDMALKKCFQRDREIQCKKMTERAQSEELPESVGPMTMNTFISRKRKASKVFDLAPYAKYYKNENVSHDRFNKVSDVYSLLNRHYYSFTALRKKCKLPKQKTKKETFNRMNSQKLLESHVMEYLPNGIKNQNAVHSASIDVVKKMSEGHCYGNLSIKLGDQEEESAKCQFLLGSKSKVKSFLNKFTEVFTENNSKPSQTFHSNCYKDTSFPLKIVSNFNIDNILSSVMIHNGMSQNGTDCNPSPSTSTRINGTKFRNIAPSD